VPIKGSGFKHQMRNPLGEGEGFAGSGPGYNHHRTALMFNGLSLFGVQVA